MRRATFLFASTPITAHTINLVPIAARLIGRGHRVLWYAASRFHERISGVGAEPYGFTRGAGVRRSRGGVRGSGQSARDRRTASGVRRPARRGRGPPGARPRGTGRRPADRRGPHRRDVRGGPALARAGRAGLGQPGRRTPHLRRRRHPAVRGGSAADARPGGPPAQPGDHPDPAGADLGSGAGAAGSDPVRARPGAERAVRARGGHVAPPAPAGVRARVRVPPPRPAGPGALRRGPATRARPTGSCRRGGRSSWPTTDRRCWSVRARCGPT